MSEKKNIDKLFKEQFKDFEEAPRDIVWERIENELHKDKRKRRVIPIWWKVAGVAAILVLLFTIGNTIGDDFGNDNPSEQEIVDTESKPEELKDQFQKDNSNELEKSSNRTVSEDIENTSVVDQNNSLKSTPTEKGSTPKSTPTINNNSNAVVSTHSNSDEKQNTVVHTTNDKLPSNQVPKKNDYNSSEQDAKRKSKMSTSSSIKNAVAETSKNENQNSDTKVNSNPIQKEQSEIDKLIKETTKSTETQVVSVTESEKEKSKSTIDTSSVKELVKEENAIEKAIAEAEKDEEDKKEEEEEDLKRWSVAPNVAPVYFNTLGKGSSLDNQFVENSKEGDVTVSYGVKGSYALSKKLKLRAGVNKVDLGYSTNNVLVFDDVNSTNPTARQMQNVDVHNSQASGTYVSANTLSLGNGPEILKAKEHASIDQQLGFIEVPIELEYSVVDNRIGLNLIGGFSTLFLNNNEIYSVENNGNRTLMGEATNIKDMSYSANLGVGVNYNISKQLRFNLEPTFKYQINTFSNTSGDFQPFFIGVYTGLSFKF